MKKFIYLLIVLCLGLLLTPNILMAEEKVDVKIPTYNITVNETGIDNYSSKYPFISYKGITYFPMTWSYANSLGLDIKWDTVNGLEITKKDNHKFSKLEQDLSDANDLNKTYKASIPKFKIVVNGTEINNSKEEYPILNFRDITYFPATWRFAVDEFGWKTKWNDYKDFSADEVGLIIASSDDFSLNMIKLPKKQNNISQNNEPLKVLNYESYLTHPSYRYKSIEEINELHSETGIKTSIQKNIIGTPELILVVKNMTNKEIDAFEFSCKLYDAFDRPAYKIGTNNNIFDGIAQQISLPAPVEGLANKPLYFKDFDFNSNEKTLYTYWDIFTWNLTLYETASKVKDISINKVHFTDGTVWER